MTTTPSKVNCPLCAGEGKSLNALCDLCGGQGTVDASRLGGGHLDVEVDLERQEEPESPSPQEILSTLLERLSSGEIEMENLLVVYDGPSGTGISSTKMNSLEAIGFLELAKSIILDSKE